MTLRSDTSHNVLGREFENVFIWVSSTCWCLSVPARVYQSIFTFSPLGGSDVRLVWVAALGRGPDWGRRMSTHNTDSLSQQRPQFPPCRPRSRHWAGHQILHVYHHISPNKSCLTSHHLLQIQKETQCFLSVPKFTRLVSLFQKLSDSLIEYGAVIRKRLN